MLIANGGREVSQHRLLEVKVYADLDSSGTPKCSESAREAAQWCAFGATRSIAHARIERDYAPAIAQGHTVTLLLHNLWGGAAAPGVELLDALSKDQPEPVPGAPSPQWTAPSFRQQHAQLLSIAVQQEVARQVFHSCSNADTPAAD